MKRILVADSDRSALEVLARGLEACDDCEVLTAESAQLAAQLLRSVTVDLVVADLSLQGSNGFRLLSHLAELYPQTPLVVTGAERTAAVEAGFRDLGAIRYFEKPLDVEQVATEIAASVPDNAAGSIRGVSLSAFLQMIEMEEKSCTLAVRMQKRVGSLSFLHGKLSGAAVDDLRGEEAVYEMLGWDNPSIRVEGSSARSQAEIQQSLAYILMEGHRRRDEARKAKTGPKEAPAQGRGTRPVSPERGLGIGAPAPVGGTRVAATPGSGDLVSRVSVNLRAAKGVEGFLLLSPEDEVLVDHGRSVGLQASQFSECRSLVRDLCLSALGGTLRYVEWRTSGGRRCVLWCMPGLDAVVVLASGHYPYDLVSKLRRALGAARQGVAS